jgi:endonuclease YncB( thermonuclease family)
MFSFRGLARYSATLLLCSACLGGFVARAQEADPPIVDEPTPEAIVSRVIDGSTLDAEINGRRVAVGYLGIETLAANQPCGQAALQRNRELVGDHVLLMSDPQYEFDPLGRRLYYAFTADGVSIDETLVREGLARAVRTDGIEGGTLEAAEAEASAAGRGCIWGENAPTG